MEPLVYGMSSFGDRVAECVLAPDDASLLPGIAEEARGEGAARLWVHCPADLSAAGLTRREGYRRFVAGTCPAGKPLPLLDVGTVAELWPRAFRGQWGHRQVDADLARSLAAEGDSVFIGLREQGHEQGQWIALCRIDLVSRVIDGPGFAGRPRAGDAVQRLVLGACALLGTGPVTVETWGEPPGPYLALGFELAEDGGGWELMLNA